MLDFEWHGTEVLNAAKIVLDKVSKEVAENVMADAKRILKQKAKTTTAKGLLSQFSIQESKFKDGGWLVYCQGPGYWYPPYHASFFELGTFKEEPKPFMRPAYKRYKTKAKRMFQEGLDRL
jgi:HK97 gp10 family phage protein